MDDFVDEAATGRNVRVGELLAELLHFLCSDRGWIRGGNGADELWRTTVEWLRHAHVPIAEPAPPPPDPTRRSKEIDWLETAVLVEPLRDTRLVDIHVEHTNPDAARTTTTWNAVRTGSK